MKFLQRSKPNMKIRYSKQSILDLGAIIEYILKITESANSKPNKETLSAMQDIEEGKNCDSFASADEMFQAYDIQSVR